MVLRGQYLERPALIPCGELTLEGLYHRGTRAPALLCCPPVDESGMDAPPLAELAWACARAGHPSLRFQHRGVGASGGIRDLGRALEDAEAALSHLAATARGSLAVAGLGSGCETALALLRAHPEVGSGVLIAPPKLLEMGTLVERVVVLVPDIGSAPPPGTQLGRVEVIPGADRAFRAGLTTLGRMVVGFLEER